MTISMVVHLQLIRIEASLHGIREPLVRYVATDHGWFKHLHPEFTLIVAKPCDCVCMIPIPFTKGFKFPMPLIIQPL